jgi:hypothetical protein
VWWDRDFVILLLDNTFLLSSKLDSENTEVGSSKIQCIKQPMFVSAEITPRWLNNGSRNKSHMYDWIVPIWLTKVHSESRKSYLWINCM